MPICPKCSATIHAGAEDQCPACGYNITQADELFGDGQVEFTRVVDAAGALTHQERLELMHTLERLERKIQPVALCIYITDVGQVQELRTHAHWILNHARIHHPSFGKRDQLKAIEESELRMRQPGESRPAQEEEQSWLARAWNTLRERVTDFLHPIPPPVRHEWMLILVLDVQLEMACFSWGYKLDPYISADGINACIKSAQLEFRERAIVPALKIVMRKARNHIAAKTRTVNRKLRRAQKLGALVAAMGLMLSSTGMAEEAPAPPPAETTQAAAPAEDGMPHWRADDYRHLMAGELLTGYSALFPPKPTPEEIKAEQERQKQLKREQREQQRQRKLPVKTTRPLEKPEESDTRVLGRYCESYTKPAKNSFLNDPQGLLSTVEREDVKHVLRDLNANSKFHIYVTVFKGGQDIPSELSVDILVAATAQPCEYAVLMRYPIGNPASIQLGYQEIKPEENQRLEWLQQVRAAADDGSAEGLMSALHCIKNLITPTADSFTPISTSTGAKTKLIEIDFQTSNKPKKETIAQKIERTLQNPLVIYLGVYPLGIGLILWGGWWFINLVRKSSRLMESEPDLRLSSPYGAGVSRHVRYLEGKEAGKEKRLF